MKQGFTYQVAPKLIREAPGMTAPEVAVLALNRGLCQSDASDPVFSLASSLAKMVRDGLHTEVRREFINKWRYYPMPGN